MITKKNNKKKTTKHPSVWVLTITTNDGTRCYSAFSSFRKAVNQVKREFSYIEGAVWDEDVADTIHNDGIVTDGINEYRIDEVSVW